MISVVDFFFLAPNCTLAVSSSSFMQAHDIPLKGKGAHVPLLHILSKTVFKKTQQQSITQNHLQLLARPNHSEKVCLDQRAEKREKYLQIKLERYCLDLTKLIMKFICFQLEN